MRCCLVSFTIGPGRSRWGFSWNFESVSTSLSSLFPHGVLLALRFEASLDALFLVVKRSQYLAEVGRPYIHAMAILRSVRLLSNRPVLALVSECLAVLPS